MSAGLALSLYRQDVMIKSYFWMIFLTTMSIYYISDIFYHKVYILELLLLKNQTDKFYIIHTLQEIKAKK